VTSLKMLGAQEVVVGALSNSLIYGLRIDGLHKFAKATIIGTMAFAIVNTHMCFILFYFFSSEKCLFHGNMISLTKYTTK